MASLPPLFIPTAAQVESFTGSLLLGFLFAWGLFGLLTSQVYMYSQVFIKDRPTTKILVYFVYSVQFVQLVLFTKQGFQVFVAGFGDFLNLDDVRDSWLSGCILDGIVGCTVQIFYAWRIKIISGRKGPSAIILITSLISLVAAILSGAYSKSLGHLSKLFVTRVFVFTGVWEASAALCDILIAGFTVYYLKRRSPQGPQFASTSALINRIVQLAIETGALTASASIAIIVVTYLPGHPGYFIGFVASLSGLYANCLMAMLNSRIRYSLYPHSAARMGESEFDRHLSFRHGDIHKENLRKHRPSYMRDDVYADRGGVLIKVTQGEIALETNFKQSTSTINPHPEPHSLSNEHNC